MITRRNVLRLAGLSWLTPSLPGVTALTTPGWGIYPWKEMGQHPGGIYWNWCEDAIEIAVLAPTVPGTCRRWRLYFGLGSTALLHRHPALKTRYLLNMAWAPKPLNPPCPELGATGWDYTKFWEKRW